MSFAAYGQSWKNQYAVFDWKAPSQSTSGNEIAPESLGYLLYVTDKRGTYSLYDSTDKTRVVGQFKKGCYRAYVVAYLNDSENYLESEPSEIERFCIR